MNFPKFVLENACLQKHDRLFVAENSLVYAQQRNNEENGSIHTIWDINLTRDPPVEISHLSGAWSNIGEIVPTEITIQSILKHFEIHVKLSDL